MPSTKKEKPIEVGEIVSSEEIFKNKSFLIFVIDGEVVDTFLCDKRMSAILQSNPTVIEVKGKDHFLNGPYIGWKYDGNNFYSPSIDNEV